MKQFNRMPACPEGWKIMAARNCCSRTHSLTSSFPNFSGKAGNEVARMKRRGMRVACGKVRSDSPFGGAHDVLDWYCATSRTREAAAFLRIDLHITKGNVAWRHKRLSVKPVLQTLRVSKFMGP
jgi:hypothetical protein